METIAKLPIEEIKKYLKYDVSTGNLIWLENRGKGRRGEVAGHKCKDGYISILIKGKRYRAHQLAWAIFHNRYAVKMIDHIDGNSSNNLIENLREVSNRENSQNRKVHRNGRLYGSFFCKNGNYWSSLIRANGLRINLGRFETEMDAHNAYVLACEKYDRSPVKITKKRKVKG